MNCAACQRSCRSTSLAHVATPDGNVRRARVCGTCFDRALHIVPSVTTIKKGVDEVTAARRDAKDVTKAAVKKLRMLSNAYAAKKVGLPNEIAANEGRAEGLDQAADILAAGDF